MSILFAILGFLLAISIIVTIHEGGHCLMAKLLGVKVLRFSLGMGPVLWRRQWGETEYCLSLIPMGGYVKMLGENEGLEDDVPEADRRRAFEAVARWKRALIVFAGPAINFILAFCLYAVIGAIGTQDLATVMGNPPPKTQAYEAGIREGDRLVEIDGERVRGIMDVSSVLLNRAGHSDIRMMFVREGTPFIRHFSLADKSLDDMIKTPGIALLGLQPFMRDPMVREVVPASPAEKAGLQKGDRIHRVNGVEMTSVSQVIESIRSSSGSVELYVSNIATPTDFRSVTMIPELVDGRPMLGVRIVPIPEFVTIRLAPIDAVIAGYRRVERITMLQVKSVGEMATGETSAKNLSGPIGIADMAGNAARSGLLPFLEFVALISVAIGFMNLLPIPMLDGGQLVILGLEGMRQKDFSELTRERLQRAGLFLMLLLFVFAMNNDLTRLFG